MAGGIGSLGKKQCVRGGDRCAEEMAGKIGRKAERRCAEKINAQAETARMQEIDS